MHGTPYAFFDRKEQYRSVRSIIDFQKNEKIKFGEYTLGTENDYAVVYAIPIY